jgi:EAL domain-containing protein (putative c-di-GMP-specific phosphodiesterase class I)
MSVNLSARQFQQPDLLEVVTNALQHTGLAPRHLKLEITESVAMRDAESTIETLRALTDLGVQLAIDDFGTGYSSLAYLHKFPLHALKIDRSFVAKLGNGVDNAAVIRTVIALAKALSLHVTAEGIETEAQALELKGLGCELGQGYLFSRPQPSEALFDILAESSPSLADAQSAA